MVCMMFIAQTISTYLPSIKVGWLAAYVYGAFLHLGTGDLASWTDELP